MGPRTAESRQARPEGPLNRPKRTALSPAAYRAFAPIERRNRPGQMCNSTRPVLFSGRLQNSDHVGDLLIESFATSWAPTCLAACTGSPQGPDDPYRRPPRAQPVGCLGLARVGCSDQQPRRHAHAGRSFGGRFHRSRAEIGNSVQRPGNRGHHGAGAGTSARRSACPRTSHTPTTRTRVARPRCTS